MNTNIINSFSKTTLGLIAGLLISHSAIAGDAQLPSGFTHLESAYFNHEGSTAGNPVERDLHVAATGEAFLPAGLEHLRSAYYKPVENQIAVEAVSVPMKSGGMAYLPAGLEHLRSAYFQETAVEPTLNGMASTRDMEKGQPRT